MAPKPVKPPPRVEEPRTQVEPRQSDPELVAPPPAYGNKVVMARSPSKTTDL